MVTTNSLEVLNISIDTLANSEHVEDQDTALEAKQLLDAVVAKIMPIMKYVDVPIDCDHLRAIEVIPKSRMESGVALYLDRDGMWRYGSDPNRLSVSSEGWMNYPFSMILEGLEHALKNAEDKKRAHLDAVRARREAISKMMQSIQ